MAATPVSAFAVDGAIGTSFGFASTTVALPGTNVGTDTVLRVANLGPCHVTVKLGTGALTVNQSNGLVILAGETEYLAIPAGATLIAGVAAGGPGNASTVNLATGN